MSSKATFSSSASKSYALALYEISKENSELDNIENEIKSFAQLVKESEDFKEMILSPTVSKDDKKNVIFAIVEKNNFSTNLKKFLGFVAMKNRLFYLNSIIENFLDLVSKNKGELKAKLISAKKLSIDEQKRIQSELSQDFKSNLKIDYKYDPELIAGLTIQVGSLMVDNSIKTKLKKIEKNLIET